MDYEKIAPQFGNWAPMFRKFIESEDMNNIFKFLREEVKKNKRIAPISSDVFKCFRETNKDRLKAIIVGMCPYHTWENDKPVADGLCLSCSYTVKTKGLQPSLKYWYEELSRVYNVEPNKSNLYYGDMKYLAEQGVLCYNVALTTEESKPMSHEAIWSKFTEYFFKEVLNKYFRGLPILFLGQAASKTAVHLTPMLHYQFDLPHPASVGYSGGDKWGSQGVFPKIDKILKENNNETVWWLDDLPF